MACAFDRSSAGSLPTVSRHNPMSSRDLRGLGAPARRRPSRAANSREAARRRGAAHPGQRTAARRRADRAACPCGGQQAPPPIVETLAPVLATLTLRNAPFMSLGLQELHGRSVRTRVSGAAEPGGSRAPWLRRAPGSRGFAHEARGRAGRGETRRRRRPPSLARSCVHRSRIGARERGRGTRRLVPARCCSRSRTISS